MWAPEIHFGDEAPSYEMRRLDLLTGAWHEEPAQFGAELLAHKLSERARPQFPAFVDPTDLYHMDANGTLTIHSKWSRECYSKWWSSYRVAFM